MRRSTSSGKLLEVAMRSKYDVKIGISKLKRYVRVLIRELVSTIFNDEVRGLKRRMDVMCSLRAHVEN